VRHCGCKSTHSFQLNKPFSKVFSKYFLTNWFFDIYKQSFLRICELEVGLFDDLDSFGPFSGWRAIASPSKKRRFAGFAQANQESKLIFVSKEPENPHPDPLQRRGRRDTKAIPMFIREICG
jgi:hypothetical protein